MTHPSPGHRTLAAGVPYFSRATGTPATGNEWTVALGSGFTKTTVFNRRPMHIGVTFDHNVERPDGTAGQQLRFSVTLLNPDARSRQMITHEHGAGSLPQPEAGECPRPGMVWIPGRTYQMGSEKHYPEERPVHRVSVDGFWIDRFPVTNEVYARFVEATGHVTFAEIPPDAAQYPGALPEMLFAGSLVFVQPGGPVDRRDMRNWWHFVKGADWRHPQGPDSSIDGRERHPVVHVAYADAEAFAGWAGKSLPTEAEWELAARGGLEGAAYAWGDTFLPGDQHMANTWQGQFPWESTDRDGYRGTSPVGAFPANGYGLHDMIGNVWEWTTDWYVPKHPNDPIKACCTPHNPRGPQETDSYDPRQPAIRIPRKVIKGGSHLCAPNYCRRYRPSARFPEPIDTSTCHLGFRCIVRPEKPSGASSRA